MDTICNTLLSQRDETYAAFIARLTPSVTADSVIGVRMPVLRRIAANVAKTDTALPFLDTLPHIYYEENLLHVQLVDLLFRDYGDALARTERFLPYVDNWAVCDTFRPCAFHKNRPDLKKRVSVWLGSERVYTVRFGTVILMRHFLEKDFAPALLRQAMQIDTDEYYINMALAWLLCEALIKQYPVALPFLESGCLNKWMHNKAIQKSVESYRLSDEKKAYLRTLSR